MKQNDLIVQVNKKSGEIGFVKFVLSANEITWRNELREHRISKLKEHMVYLFSTLNEIEGVFGRRQQKPLVDTLINNTAQSIREMYDAMNREGMLNETQLLSKMVATAIENGHKVDNAAIEATNECFSKENECIVISKHWDAISNFPRHLEFFPSSKNTRVGSAYAYLGFSQAMRFLIHLLFKNILHLFKQLRPAFYKECKRNHLEDGYECTSKWQTVFSIFNTMGSLITLPLIYMVIYFTRD